jgi:hypothetical protein
VANTLSVDTDGVLTAYLAKTDGTALQRAEVTSLTLTLKTRRTGYGNVATPRAIATTALDVTSGWLNVALLNSEQIILTAGQKEETHRAQIRGVLADGRKFLFWQDFKVTNEET